MGDMSTAHEMQLLLTWYMNEVESGRELWKLGREFLESVPEEVQTSEFLDDYKLIMIYLALRVIPDENIWTMEDFREHLWEELSNHRNRRRKGKAAHKVRWEKCRRLLRERFLAGYGIAPGPSMQPSQHTP